MKVKRIGKLLLVTTMAAFFLTGCGAVKNEAEVTSTEVKASDVSEEAVVAETEKLRIGVCMFTKNDEWGAEISNQFEAQGKEKGYEISVQDANLENEKQVQQIENFISKQYDAIIISAADVAGISPALDKCQEAKIPVIAFDTPIDHEWVSTCITWDNYKTGKELGAYAVEYIQKNMQDKEVVNVVMINAPAYPHLVARDDGFRDSLKTEPKAKIIVEQESPGSREIAANIINNNIAKGIDIVYGVVDNHAWGAVTALEEAQAEVCYVLSCGGYGEEPFNELEKGNKYYKAIIVVPPANIVKDSFMAVEKTLKGETIEPITNIEFNLVTEENVQNFK